MTRTNIGRRLDVAGAVLAREAAEGTGIGVVAVAEALGREKSQVSRALRTLTDAGLLERDEVSLEFAVGRRLLELAGRGGDQVLLNAALPILHRLAAAAAERVGLIVRRGPYALVVETVAGPSALQAVGMIGRMSPLDRAAGGRALLFDFGRDQIAPILANDALPAEIDHVVARIAAERQRGFAVADTDNDVIVLAAPVRDAAGSVCAALDLSGPSVRLAPQLTQVAETVLRAAADLTAKLSSPSSGEVPRSLSARAAISLTPR